MMTSYYILSRPENVAALEWSTRDILILVAAFLVWLLAISLAARMKKMELAERERSMKTR